MDWKGKWICSASAIGAGWSIFDNTLGVIDMVRDSLGLLAAFLPTIGMALMAGGSVWAVISIKEWLDEIREAKRMKFNLLTDDIFRCRESMSSPDFGPHEKRKLSRLFRQLQTLGIACPAPENRELCIMFLDDLEGLAVKRNLAWAKTLCEEIEEMKISPDTQ